MGLGLDWMVGWDGVKYVKDQFHDTIFMAVLPVTNQIIGLIYFATILFAQSQRRYPTAQTRRGRRIKRRGVVNCNTNIKHT